MLIGEKISTILNPTLSRRYTVHTYTQVHLCLPVNLLIYRPRIDMREADHLEYEYVSLVKTDIRVGIIYKKC
jgi:hypothetical protein